MGQKRGYLAGREWGTEMTEKRALALQEDILSFQEISFLKFLILFGLGKPVPTLWLVIIALPSLHLMFRGSLPGKEFGLCKERAVREGDVNRIFSRGSRTKSFIELSSITQLDLGQLWTSETSAPQRLL